MIPICFRKKGAVNRLYHILLNVKPTQKNKVEYLKNIRAINKWCLKNISVSGKKYSLPDVIKADYSEIAEIANVYNSRQIKMPQKYKKFIIDTLYKQRFPRKEFAEELQVTVCPYCNRNFVNSTYKRTMCDLDHFYDKETYPILAVSFHNLVPVCHACNHAKASNAISYSPHNTKFNTDDLLTASLPGINTNKNTSGTWVFTHDKKATQALIQELFYYRDNTEELTENAETTTNNVTSNTSTNSTINNTVTSNKKSDIKIEILNGSGDSKKLQKAVSELEGAGYKVTRTGTTNSTSKTTIIDKKDVSNTLLQNMKEVLGTGVIQNSQSSSSKVDVTIIIGKDY